MEAAGVLSARKGRLNSPLAASPPGTPPRSHTLNRGRLDAHFREGLSLRPKCLMERLISLRPPAATKAPKACGHA